MSQAYPVIFIKPVASLGIWSEFQLVTWPVRFIVDNVHKIHKVMKPV